MARARAFTGRPALGPVGFTHYPARSMVRTVGPLAAADFDVTNDVCPLIKVDRDVWVDQLSVFVGTRTSTGGSGGTLIWMTDGQSAVTAVAAAQVLTTGLDFSTSSPLFTADFVEKNSEDHAASFLMDVAPGALKRIPGKSILAFYATGVSYTALTWVLVSLALREIPQ